MNLQPGNALAYLIDTLFNLYLLVLWMRILLEAVRADYYNPVSQIIIRVTEPAIAPLRKLLPNIGRLSLAGLAGLVALQFAALMLLTTLSSGDISLPMLLAAAVVRLIRMVLLLYLVLILVGVVMSWIGGGRTTHPIVPMIHQLNEPVLTPIRRVLPTLAGLDLSPLVAVIAINFILRLLPVV